MYAIVEIAGKQFRVAKDMKIKVPLLEVEAGKSVAFDRVLFVGDEKGGVKFGKPVVSGTSITAKVIEHGRDPKVIVFKKKRRKGYQKKQGHRQDFSLIEITGIGAAQTAKKSSKAETESAAPAAKTSKSRTAKKPATAKKAAPADKTASVKAPSAGTKTAAVKKPAAASAKKSPTAKKATTEKKKSGTVQKTSVSTAKKDLKED